jgi:diadenosine tetraphosphate (Ap4A) HIT family hydrolase
MTIYCPLCRVSQGVPTNGFLTLFGVQPPLTEVVGDCGDLIVVLDVAPLTPGHVLVIHRTHIRSFAPIWTGAPNNLHVIDNAVQSVLSRNGRLRTIACEHGLGVEAPGRAGCVDHAHLHIIPTKRSLLQAFRRAGVEFRKLGAYSDEPFCAPHEQYLYLRDCDGNRYVSAAECFPSQLVRRLVAQVHGEIFWSWRDYLDFADVIGTRERIAEGARLLLNLREHPIFSAPI